MNSEGYTRDFVKDFYELRMIFGSYESGLNQILQIKESVKYRVLDRLEVAYFAVSSLHLVYEYLRTLFSDSSCWRVFFKI